MAIRGKCSPDRQNLSLGRQDVLRRISLRGVLDAATLPGLGGGLDGRGFPCASIWPDDWSFMSVVGSHNLCWRGQ
jgi:hypothetical protein